MSAEMMTLSIGRAAVATGLSAHTIRYYEQRGVLPRSVRTDSNCRRYDRAALDLLMVIRRGRDAGLSLSALAALLSPGGAKPQTLQAQLSAIQRQLMELQAWQAALETALERSATDSTQVLVRQLSGVAPRPVRRKR